MGNNDQRKMKVLKGGKAVASSDETTHMTNQQIF